MANIKLLVSGLKPYVSDVNAALPYVVQAFAPFGINIQIGSGLLLDQDPGETASGWFNLLQALTNITAKAGNERPAHIVFTTLAATRDPTVNGELKLRSRGVCAIYLAASSLQHIDPGERMRRIIEVSVHELGHLLNMTHSDGFKYAAHACSMMPSNERHLQTPMQAWTLAVQDAAHRHEPPLQVPSPVTYYPFAGQCRAILREAAFNKAWWPWANDFRGSFDEPGEAQDKNASVDLSLKGKVLGATVDDGIAFTLAIRTGGDIPVEVPLHIGPEFSNLRITVTGPDGNTVLFQPENVRCSDATLMLAPSKTIFRSFSLVPHPDEPLFPLPGEYLCSLALLSSIKSKAVMLGSTQAPVKVTMARQGLANRRLSARIVSSARGLGDSPPHRVARSALDSASPSVTQYHARYKLASSARTHKQRRTMLEQCMVPAVPTAIRHRAARSWAKELVDNGASFNEVRDLLISRFTSADDEELYETLERMEEGWKSVKA
jgi:hypothetical protein